MLGLFVPSREIRIIPILHARQFSVALCLLCIVAVEDNAVAEETIRRAEMFDEEVVSEFGEITSEIDVFPPREEIFIAVNESLSARKIPFRKAKVLAWSVLRSTDTVPPELEQRIIVSVYGDQNSHQGLLILERTRTPARWMVDYVHWDRVFMPIKGKLSYKTLVSFAKKNDFLGKNSTDFVAIELVVFDKLARFIGKVGGVKETKGQSMGSGKAPG